MDCRNRNNSKNERAEMPNLVLFGRFGWNWWRYAEHTDSCSRVFRQMVKEVSAAGNRRALVIKRPDSQSIYYAYIVRVSWWEYFGVGMRLTQMPTNLCNLLADLRGVVDSLSRLEYIIKYSRSGKPTITGESFDSRRLDIRIFLEELRFDSIKQCVPLSEIDCSVGSSEVVKREFEYDDENMMSFPLNYFVNPLLKKGYPNIMIGLSYPKQKNAKARRSSRSEANSRQTSEARISMTATLAGTSSNPSITIRWNPVSGVTNYKVFRSTSIDRNFYEIATTGNCISHDSNVWHGNTYYYMVKAMKSNNVVAVSKAAVRL